MLREEEEMSMEKEKIVKKECLIGQPIFLVRLILAKGGEEPKLETKSEILFGIGEDESESSLEELIRRLFAEGRISDIEIAAKDEEGRNRFYKEFGIM